MKWLRGAGATLLLLGATTGCASGLLFVNNHLITITSPRQYSTVRLPVLLRFRVMPDSGAVRYAVFLDRAPMPPGSTVAHFSADDRQGIAVISNWSLLYRTMPRRQGAPAGEQDQHEITVVDLDASGRRIGETEAFVDFTLKRSAG